MWKRAVLCSTGFFCILFCSLELRIVLLRRESALLVFNGEHLLPAERPYAWLGSLRPSEAAAGLLAKLGDDASTAALGRLHTLQASASVSFK